MKSKEIAELFYMEIFRLSGLDYNPSLVKSQSLYLRSAAEKFIYDDMVVEERKVIENKAKSSRMAIPPALHLVIDFGPVEYQTLKFLEVSKDCSTIEELELALNKKPASSDERAGFDDLLSAFMH